jgi:DNA-binding transcriptional MerR regulator
LLLLLLLLLSLVNEKKNYYYYRRKTIIFLKIKKYKNLGRQIKFIINIININVGSSIAAIPNAFGS